MFRVQRAPPETTRTTLGDSYGHTKPARIGFIPFVGLLSLFIYPINLILAIASVITGIIGIRRAKETGVGQGQAIAGTIIGSLYLLLQLVIIVMMGGLGVVLVMLENM